MGVSETLPNPEADLRLQTGAHPFWIYTHLVRVGTHSTCEQHCFHQDRYCLCCHSLLVSPVLHQVGDLVSIFPFRPGKPTSWDCESKEGRGTWAVG